MVWPSFRAGLERAYQAEHVRHQVSLPSNEALQSTGGAALHRRAAQAYLPPRWGTLCRRLATLQWHPLWESPSQVRSSLRIEEPLPDCTVLSAQGLRLAAPARPARPLPPLPCESIPAQPVPCLLLAVLLWKEGGEQRLQATYAALGSE